ncbi:unnamed protein product [Thelazia callipaeda]|uniref:FERM domain-containing protein n=1 Tax=Thelazia callipaeda TaxID=103827 RepID=A0A0N5CUK2_THECL|nr:unnamed protein product [Thelazia callipaeda]
MIVSKMLHMPLKLKWGKKSGRYDLSQDIYVLTVFLGDYAILQCTLTTESTASQCMEYLSQKVDLNQVEMFGLRYQMKTNDPDHRMMRWVELDKPLRRQLEKWACKPRQVQLAVLYHTPNAFTLTDQMARSYYFFLMKLDVVEGKLTVALEKYINLAAYSLQVEYGDFDPTIHTIDFMQTIPLLPKHICRNAQIQEDLLKRVSAVHERLKGMQPSYAALLYIVDAQQCEGYGEEYFIGKDEDSTEVKIGYSQEGVIIKEFYGAPVKHKWEDIKDIQAVKRHLNIRLHDGTLVQFTMEDIEMARYVAMVITWQFRYATNKAIVEKNYPMNINNLQGSIRTFNQMRSSNAELNSSRLNGSDYASLIYMMMPEPTYCSSTQRLSPTKPLSQRSLLQATSMCNLSTYNNSSDNQLIKRSPLTSLLQYSQPHNGIFLCSFIVVTSTTVPRELLYTKSEMISRNALSKSAAALNFSNDEEYDISHPSVLYRSTSSLVQNNEQNTASSPEVEEDEVAEVQKYANPECKFEFRSFAFLRKRHLAQSMTGSSPEIRMIGRGMHRSAAALVHKHSLNEDGPQKISPAHALSSPDLISTCRSSPDLITSVLERYKLAVAEAELRASAASTVAPLQKSHPQSQTNAIQTTNHWRTVNNDANHSVPAVSSPGINVPQANLNDNSLQIDDTKSKPAIQRFLMMGLTEGKSDGALLSSVTKECGSSSKAYMKSVPFLASLQQPFLCHQPVMSKVKGHHQSQAHHVSYLAQAGHIYYPPSSPLTQNYETYRKESNERGNTFGNSNESNTMFSSNNPKLPLLHSTAQQRYEVIEEDRTPETFTKRVHDLYPPSSSTTQSYAVMNPHLTVTTSRSISSPDVFSTHTKNVVSKQSSASSNGDCDSKQSLSVLRSIPILEKFSHDNDYSTSFMINSNESESPRGRNVCNKATNTCEAVS